MEHHVRIHALGAAVVVALGLLVSLFTSTCVASRAYAGRMRQQNASQQEITVKGCAQALDYYKKAFGAVEQMRMPTPDGAIMHASITIGDSVIMLNDENPQWNAIGPATLGSSPVTIHLYVEDVDRAFKRAIDAGATAIMPPTDMFWGDRYGVLTDPFGHVWSIATHTQDLTPDQMKERAASAMCPST